MVELPRHVKVRTKASGRVFVYYERFRSTPRAWPRLGLPSDLGSPEFWTRCGQCERLEAEQAGERWRFFWPGAEGRRHELPDPRAEGGSAAFWLAVDAAIVAERDLAAGEGKTFRALIALYRQSPSFTNLSASARGDYERYLGSIMAAWADDPVASLSAPDAQQAVDAYAHAPASGRFFRAVLSRLVAFGIPRGFSTTNVVEHTEKPAHKTDPYKPWPEWALDILFEHVRPALLLPALSALYTGQRKVDVVGMWRPAKDAVAIELVARKTGKSVWAPIHPAYRAAMAASALPGDDKLVELREKPRRLHLREDGEPWEYEGFSTAWQRDMTFGAPPSDASSKIVVRRRAGEVSANPGKTAAMARVREADLVFHGFRKNAVNMLLEVGSTEAEVSAVVEMSEQMVRHYAKDVDKRRLAVNAMRKMEAQWAGFSLPARNG